MLARWFSTMWSLHVFLVAPDASPLVENGDISLIGKRNWSRTSCHSNITLNNISRLTWHTLLVPSLNRIHSLSEIFLILRSVLILKLFVMSSVFWTKPWISRQRKKIFRKRKCHSSLWKTFQIRINYFHFIYTLKNISGCGFDSHRGHNISLFTSCGSLIPLIRANAQWVFHGFHLVL